MRQTNRQVRDAFLRVLEKIPDSFAFETQKDPPRQIWLRETNNFHQKIVISHS